MKIDARSTLESNPSEIAKALFGASPQEFASTFTELYILFDRSKEGTLKMQDIAKAMSPVIGSGNRAFWHQMHNWIVFYEMANANGLNRADRE